MTTKLLLTLVAAVFAAACQPAAEPFDPQQIIALERGALDRWGKGDPQGFFDIMAPDVTYFDPRTDQRLQGVETLKKYFAPFAGKISIERIEFIDPKVQRVGDLAVLSLNLKNYGAQFAGGPKSTSSWNTTEVYQRINGAWRIIHSHWSYTKPELVNRDRP